MDLLSFLKRTALSAVGANLAFVPVWTALVVRFTVEPESSWHKALLSPIGCFFLGSAQGVLFVLFLFWLYLVWTVSTKAG